VSPAASGGGVAGGSGSRAIDFLVPTSSWRAAAAAGAAGTLPPSLDRRRGLRESRSDRRRRGVGGGPSSHPGEPAAPGTFLVRRDAGRLRTDRGAQLRLGLGHRSIGGKGRCAKGRCYNDLRMSLTDRRRFLLDAAKALALAAGSAVFNHGALRAASG